MWCSTRCILSGRYFLIRRRARCCPRHLLRRRQHHRSLKVSLDQPIRSACSTNSWVDQADGWMICEKSSPSIPSRSSGDCIIMLSLHHSYQGRRTTTCSRSANRVRETSDRVDQAQDGIMPAWEDAQNKNGGKWSIQVPRDKTKTVIDKLWLYTVSSAEYPIAVIHA